MPLNAGFVNYWMLFYIIPGIPPPPLGMAGASSVMSTSAHSVVRIMPATEAAFSSDTGYFLWSMIPAFNMSGPDISFIIIAHNWPCLPSFIDDPEPSPRHFSTMVLRVIRWHFGHDLNPVVSSRVGGYFSGTFWHVQGCPSTGYSS